MRVSNCSVIPTPIFTPLAEDWFAMRSPFHDALDRGVPLTPILPLGPRRSEASLGLVPDEVTVPGCFGTGITPYPYLFTPSTEKGVGQV